jgi:tetratricopeptide (TPR) repeat protein
VSSTRYALLISSSMFGELVDEVSIPSGRGVQVGNSPTVVTPVPKGAPYVCKVRWISSSTVRVTDGRGDVHLLGPEQEMNIRIGPLDVVLMLNAHAPLLRVEAWSWKGSLGWLCVVLMVSMLSSQSTILYENRCEWFAINAEMWVALRCPIQTQVTESGGISDDYLAEYMARLLRKDFDGSEEGKFQPQKPRPVQPKLDESFFLPAGSKGPITDFGGAEDVGPEPIRAPPAEEKVASKKAPEETPVTPVESGTPMEETEPAEAPKSDGITDSEEAVDENAEDVPVEEEEGWGIPDWYDASAVRSERFETEYMKAVAKQQLEIDPDSAEALSILAYYQYLAEDFDEAFETYDKYIRLFPDETSGYNNKALVHKRKQEYAEEERLYRVALALQPLDVTAMNNLAVCLAHQGRYEEALSVMQQLEELDPGEPYADLHRAKIYADMGDEATAYRYLEQSLQGMKELDTLHHIEFRQDIRVDPSFRSMRETQRFHALLVRYYGDDAPIQE